MLGSSGRSRILHSDSFPNVFQFLFHFKETETGNPRELIISVIHAKMMARGNSNQGTTLKRKDLGPKSKDWQMAIYMVYVKICS